MNKYSVRTWEKVIMFRQYDLLILAEDEEEAKEMALKGEFEACELLEEFPASDYPEEVEVETIELLSNDNQRKN